MQNKVIIIIKLIKTIESKITIKEEAKNYIYVYETTSWHIC